MDVSFATYAAQKNDLLSNYLLASSIRDFAGNLSDFPLRINVAAELDVQGEMGKFAGLNVLFSTYSSGRKKYRYGFKPAAASACEADVKAGTVIWLDRHMIVLNPCVNLLLNSLEQFAYRPPHMKILGASADKPLTEMWLAACKIAGVEESILFPLYSEVDREKIWSYFSAGHFSFRAEAGIMGTWNALFLELAEHQDMKPFLDDTVRTYLHQIALTLAVLRTRNREALKPLPIFYGYPTHLHNKIERYYQASQMDQLHTAFYSPSDVKMPKKAVSKQLSAWLEGKVKQFGQDE